MKYDVYYMKPEHFATYIFGDVKPKLSALNKTHTRLKRELEMPDMEALFKAMQGEVWSPNGEVRTLILGLGLAHTSMSVGDIIRVCDTDEYFVCAVYGFDKLRL